MGKNEQGYGMAGEKELAVTSAGATGVQVLTASLKLSDSLLAMRLMTAEDVSRAMAAGDAWFKRDPADYDPDIDEAMHGPDLLVTQTYLGMYQSRQNTFANYRKELLRWVLWCAAIGKRYREISSRDIDAYGKFMANPPKDWCSEVAGASYRISSDKWRPFSEPLKRKSIEYGLVVIQTFFDWLQQGGRIPRNPFKIFKRKLGVSTAGVAVIDDAAAPNTKTRKVAKKNSKPKRVIKLSLLDEALALLEALQSKEPDVVKFRTIGRQIWVIKLIKMTGLRREEAALAMWKDVSVADEDVGGGHVLEVVGKGSKQRFVPLIEPVMVAFRQYRSEMSLPYPPDGEEFLINHVMHRKVDKGVSTSMVHHIVSTGLKTAADQIEMDGDPKGAAKLREASTHWLRHTFATELGKENDVALVQAVLGHTDMNTSSIYIHKDAEALREAVVKRLGKSSKGQGK